MAESLRRADVKSIYTYPGDPIIEFMEQSRRREIDIVLARREGTASFMAQGSAMSTGNLGVVLSTLGPGSTNLANGVACATWDRVPLLAISGQIDSAREQYFPHQVVDHGRLFASISKWSGRVEPAGAGTIMRKAIRTATADRPGAVHLTVADDAFRQIATDSRTDPPPSCSVADTFRVVRHADFDLDALIRNARRPLILAGIGAVRGNATRSLVDFAERSGAPVVVSPMAKGVFPEAHPQFAGVLDMACQAVMWDFVKGVDLILATGFDPVELILPWQVEATVVHIDDVPNTDQVYESPYELIGDVSSILDWLTEQWGPEPRWTHTEIARHRDGLRNTYYAGRVAGRLNPTDVVDVVQQGLGPDVIATSDVGSHKLLVGQGWHTSRPRTMLMSNGLSSMGFGIPAAIGATLATGTKSVALVGDGGFSMAGMDVSVAVARGLAITVVVFVDESLNRIELKQMARGYPSTGTKVEPTNVSALAEALGCASSRATNIAQLERAIGEAASHHGPFVVEARMDPAQYQNQF